MKEWSEVEESCAADALWDDDRQEEIEYRQRQEENFTPCRVDECEAEGVLEFMGEYICGDHYNSFVESQYEAMSRADGRAP